MKYKIKNPVDIEAFQYDGDFMNSDGKYYVPDWAIEALESNVMFYDAINGDSPPCDLFVSTFNGVKHVNEGDYIVRGADGFFSIWGKHIFNKIFESAE